jgi:hypothetical protein
MSASAGQATVLHSLAMGWKSIGAMGPVGRLARLGRARLGIYERAQRVRRHWRPGRRVRGIYRKLYGTPSFAELDQVTRRPSTEHRDSIVVATSASPAALADLAARVPLEGRIRHVRDSAFFEWRFGNPSQEYRFLLYESRGRVEGYMAISRSHPIPFYISDWEGTSHEVRAQLLEFAVTHGGFEGLGAWTSSLSDESKAMLARSGFTPVDPELRARGMPCVLLKKLGSGEWVIDGAPAAEPSRWDIRRIDSMTV